MKENRIYLSNGVCWGHLASALHLAQDLREELEAVMQGANEEFLATDGMGETVDDAIIQTKKVIVLLKSIMEGRGWEREQM